MLDVTLPKIAAMDYDVIITVGLARGWLQCRDDGLSVVGISLILG
jgi:hypothetical protein